MAQLALENLPFPSHQARMVLDLHARDGWTTVYLQSFLPYCTVFGLSSTSDAAALPRYGQRYLSALPNAFRCDCVVSLVEPQDSLEASLQAIEQVASRWAVVVAPASAAVGVDWHALGYQAHYEITEEPDDGVLVVAVRDREQTLTRPVQPRVLIGSPVRQKPQILQHFLEGLRRLDTTGLDVTFVFVDNNDDPAASQLLVEFGRTVGAPVRRLRLPAFEEYHRTEETHVWTESLCWRLAAIKDGLLQTALQHGFDYAFLVDSDLVLHPQTLQRMLAWQRDVVSQVFWTAWVPEAPPLPNVWYAGFYNLYRLRRGVALDQAEQRRREEAFLQALILYPGLHRIGGLGACTLISRRALEKGLSFGELRSCLLAGEDRHFCLRAEALGIRLFADTTLPPLHLYRNADLARVDTYWRFVESGLQGRALTEAVYELVQTKQLSAA